MGALVCVLRGVVITIVNTIGITRNRRNAGTMRVEKKSEDCNGIRNGEKENRNAVICKMLETPLIDQSWQEKVIRDGTNFF